MNPSLSVLDVPIDCSGASRGEERAPAALRAAGLVERLGARDAGSVDARVRDTRRDPSTGAIGADDLRRASAAIGARVTELLEAGEMPLVVGGDCSLLLGVFRGLPPPCGLWMVDGHADFLDGDSSPTGEAADMELSILTGHGPRGLLERDASPVDPADVVLVGHRPSEMDPDVARENARIDPAIEAVTAVEARERGIGRVAAAAAARLGGRAVWLHVDLDVLDARALPAVTYPQPLGLDWDELSELAGELLAAPGVVGVSLADFNPDRDPDGGHARRVVANLEAMMAGG